MRLRFEFLLRSISTWIRDNRREAVLILGIIILAFALRLYRLPEYMTFLGDEGRDALIIKRILVDHDLPLIGPPTSVGNMYLGPLYYYMMAVPMAVFWLNPVAAAAMNAVIGVGTILLIYYLARKWFGNIPATVAAVLYAVSPVTIIYSRSSWNPNPAPFFTLLALLGFDKAREKNDFKWLILTGTALAFAVQMHYLSLILIPVFGLYWLNELVEKYKGVQRRYFWRGTIAAVLAFLVLMSPLVVFDFKHNFINWRALNNFVTQNQGDSMLQLSSAQRIKAIYQDNLIGRYLSAENYWLTPLVAFLLLLPLVAVLGSRKNPEKKWPVQALGTWILVGVVGLSVYKQSIYDHYLGFLNPAPFLLIAAILGRFRGYWLGGAAAITVIVLGWVNLQESPLRFGPNNQLARTQQIADFVIAEAAGNPYNFALISKNNYDSAYQFYLWEKGAQPFQVHETVTEQLFLVCEDQVCQPVGHPKDEIAAFGMTRVEKSYEYAGVKVYKLIHNPTGAPS